MSVIMRRIVFVLFVLLFLVSAAILLFYASGYRYHAVKGVIEKTGKLIIETQPRGARVLVNDRSLPTLTPLALSFLLSGEYQITIEKEGFFPLSRHFILNPGTSVILNDIILIKKSEPQLITALPLDIRKVIVRNSSVFFVGSKEIIAYDTHLQRSAEVLRSREQIQNAAISQSGARIVAQTDYGMIVRDGSNEPLSMPAIKEKINEIRFASHSNDFYVLSAGGIFQFQKAQETFIPVVRQKGIRSFIVTGDIMYFISAEGALVEFLIPKKTVARTISDGPAFTSLEEHSNGILLLKGEGSELYLFDHQARSILFQHVSNVSGVEFIDREHVLSLNDFEIWEHTFTSDRYTRNLITRQSTPMKNILPFRRRPFLLIITQDGSVTLRSRDRDDAREMPLGRFDSVVGAFLDQQEQNLFVAGIYNKRSGLFIIPLIEKESVFPLVK